MKLDSFKDSYPPWHSASAGFLYLFPNREMGLQLLAVEESDSSSLDLDSAFTSLGENFFKGLKAEFLEKKRDG